MRKTFKITDRYNVGIKFIDLYCFFCFVFSKGKIKICFFVYKCYFHGIVIFLMFCVFYVVYGKFNLTAPKI